LRLTSTGMRARAALFLALALVGALALAIGTAPAHNRGIAYSIELSATIDPATERWLDKALDEAADRDAAVAIIRLDTPGGLDSSMRSMIKDIIAAPMPVIVYVSPNGARAASAGLYITQAADIAAMAPQTNIGSATPISIGPGEQDRVLGRKVRNDAAAYVRALTEGHGRNPDLAEQMVRKATNVTAAEAKRAGLIDVVAANQDELLRKLHGFRIKGPKAATLHTHEIAPIVQRDMPLQYDLLELLVNPTVAFLLLAVGLLGLAIELFTPGAIAPGALGLVSFILGLYGTAQLPVSVAGILLMVAAVGLLVAEAHLPTHGVLGGAGVAALIGSGLLLYDTNSEAFDISVPVVIIAGLVIGGFLAFAVAKAVQARRGPISTGWEELVGKPGVVRVRLDPVGQIFVEGALWRARAAGGGPIEADGRVRVESVEGLTLNVVPLAEESDTPVEEG
jgi:membrane-bound serine protease (ClpP class)